jgi:two-component system OmpR family sensor kinase
MIQQATLGRGLRRSFAVASLIGMIVFGIVVAIVINIHEYYDTTPEDPPLEIIQECAIALAFAGPIGLWLSFWLGRRWTSPTMMRLDNMIETSSDMTGDNLSQRLPIGPEKDPLDRLAIALNGVLDRIESGVAAQRQFAADASHELRTPLTVISTNLEVARRKTRDPGHWDRVADDTLTEVRRMHALVDKLLVLSRAGAAGLKHERTDLRALASAAVDRASRVAAELDVRVELAGGEVAYADVDSDAIAIVLDNLLRNAIDHSPKQEVVVVTIGPDSQIAVEDRGPGVPDDQRVRIFEPFARGGHDASDRTKTNGFGLGLAICKRIVAGHKG